MSPRPIYNPDGSIHGYWDDVGHCWVTAPQAADVDDAGEPEVEHPNPTVISDLTKKQLSEWLIQAGIEVPARASKAELVALVESSADLGQDSE